MIRKSSSGIWLLIWFVLASSSAIGQENQVSKSSADTISPVKVAKTAVDSGLNNKKNTSKSDTATAKKKKSESGKAALRSAIIPGWGQAYNKKYWKIPIVYGALAVPIYTFFYNKNWYEKTKYAYQVKYYNDTAAVDIPTDGIDPQLQPLSTGSCQLYRNQFRQGMDFSILAFIAIWGLQIADAAVDGHLKSFNINDDLSLRIKPYYSPVGKSEGLSMVFSLRDYRPRKSIPSF
jgi:hypothetical protein